MFNKSFWSKVLGWMGAALLSAGASSALGKYSGIAVAAGPLLVGWANHLSVQPALAK